MHTATAAPAAPLHQLLSAAPVLTALAVDFRRNQWTFTLPPQPVGPGDYLVVRAEDAQAALQERSEQTVLLQPAAVRARFAEHCQIGRGFGCYALEITDEDAGFDATLWRPHGPSAEGDWPQGPGVWYGYEERRGSDGGKWTRQLRLVCDDFGTLVSVQQ